MKITPLMILACVLSAGPSAASDTVSLEDRAAIIDTITDIAAGADRHQWERVRGAFAGTVTLDYTSLWGGEPATQQADEIIAQWSGFLPGFDRTLHLVTNHTIVEGSDEKAIAEADFQAAHHIGGEMWVLMGHYRYDLVKVADGWKVSAMTMDWTHETGNRELVARAAERTAKKN